MKAIALLAILLPSMLAAHPDPSHTLEQLEDHLREAPDDQLLLRQKADLLLSTGHAAEARPAIGKLLELDPADPHNLLLDARLSDAGNNTGEASGKAKALTAAQPQFAPGWNFLSRVEDQAGRRDEAIAAKRRYLGLSAKPGPTDVMTCASWLRERGGPGDAEAAVEVLDGGLAKLGCLSGLHYQAIGIELELRRHDSALRRIDVLVARYRPSVDLSLRRVEILEHAGRHQGAAAACDAALALLEALPARRKDNASYRQQLDLIAKRKQQNLDRAK